MLGVGPRASSAEIKKAYHSLAARYHPDKHQGNPLEDLARDKLTQINEAFRVLEDQQLRRAYDAARTGPRAVHDPARGTGSSAAPAAPARRAPLGSWSSLVILFALIVALPLLLRFFRNPRALVVVGIVLALAWFGPRIWRYFRK
ncbi:MAG TPA: J domain-containing protein [Polyangia bacterium]|nr:J domain-containing protein [Polyangia bacterium]